MRDWEKRPRPIPDADLPQRPAVAIRVAEVRVLEPRPAGAAQDLHLAYTYALADELSRATPCL